MTSRACIGLTYRQTGRGLQSRDPGARLLGKGFCSVKGWKMAHSRLKFLGVAGVALMLLAACGSSNNTPAAKVYKIGLVTDIGGLNDKSFNHLADLGLEKAKTNFASKKYDLVIGVGFLMQTAMGTVSGQFPTVNFAIIDGAGTDANFNDL